MHLGLGPGEGSGGFVVAGDERIDMSPEFIHAWGGRAPINDH